MHNELGRRLDTRVAAGDVDVPVLPDVARKVIEACEREGSDMRHLAEIVRRDPALSVQFLRLANSPAFGSRSSIVSLPQALARLGISQTRQIALLVGCQAGVFSCPARKEAAERLRFHAIGTALWAQEIARVRRMNVEESFLCGLLADVATPALWQLAADIEKGAGRVGGDTELDLHVERLHNDVGADIVRRWGLPTRVVEAIRLHHASPAAVAAAGVGSALFETVAAVQLADALANATLGGETPAMTSMQAHPATVTLSLYGEELERLLARGDVVAEAMRGVA